MVDRLRFQTPIYSVTEAAHIVDVPVSTLSRQWPPERYVGAGVPMQRIRPALRTLKDGPGIDYALASRKLYTDGAELLYGYRNRHPELRERYPLVIVHSGQYVFGDVVSEYLQPITYRADDYATLLQVPAYRCAEVIVNPTRSFGSPFFRQGGARVNDVLERFWTGASLPVTAEEFGVPIKELEDVVRVVSRRAT